MLPSDAPPESEYFHIKIPRWNWRQFRENVRTNPREYFFRFLIILGIGIYFVLQLHQLQLTKFYQLFTKKDTVVSEQNEVLTLDISSFRANASGANDDAIEMYFNDPVDPHVVEHNFYLSPPVPGRFEGFDGGRWVKFIPDEPFRRSTQYSVKITAGLTSLTGKKLLYDYYDSFQSRLADNAVQFTQNDITGRVFNLPALKDNLIQVSGKDRFNNVTLTLYRSDRERLMKFLTYVPATPDPDSQERFDAGYEDFEVRELPHPTSDRISNVKFRDDTDEINLKLPVGIYYLEATEDGKDRLGATFVVVTNTGVSYRQDDKKLLFAGFDIATGRKLEGPITVEMYNTESSPTRIASHTFSGEESAVPFPFTTRLDVVMGQNGDDTFLIPVRLPQSMADLTVGTDLDQDAQIFLYTDRPIYKPGDTVFFRGIVRMDNDSLYRVPPAGQPVHLWIGFQSSEPEIELRIPTNGAGVFSGEFTIPDDAEGNQYLYASTKPRTKYYWSEAYTYFDVAKYVKPTFSISTSVQQKEYLRNEKVTYTITGKYFDGKPLANKEVDYTFYSTEFYESEKAVYNENFNINLPGGMCGGGLGAFEEWYGSEIGKNGTVKLDKDGKATVTLSPPKDPLASQTITMVAKARDGQNDIVSAAGTIVHAGSFNIFVLPAPDRYMYGSELVQPFYAETLAGEKLADKEFTYTLLRSEYDSSTTTSKERVFLTGKVRTDGSGKGVIRRKLPADPESEEPWPKYLGIEGKDAAGNLVRIRKYISLETKEGYNSNSWWQRNDLDQTYLKIVSDKNSFLVGDDIVLGVESPAEIDALLSLERGRIYEPRLIRLVKGHNTVRIPVDEILSPSITVVFSFFADGAYHSEGLSLNVPAMHKLLQVNIKPDKEKYRPGETAQLTISTRDASGKGVPTQLSLGVIDKAIFGLRKNATPPVHSSFYYFRPRRTNASSSLTIIGSWGGGGGGGGGGDMQPTKVVDTLYWNPNITTDYSGETVISVPLRNFRTTWKAQAIGATSATDVGQGEAEFIVD